MVKNHITATEKKILNSMYWRSGSCFATFNMVKMEGNAFTITMAPAINEIYKEDEEERCRTLLRHNNFFNTHAVFLPFIAGLCFAMEKERKEKGTVDADTIESIKVALMGPAAGIGDVFLQLCKGYRSGDWNWSGRPGESSRILDLRGHLWWFANAAALVFSAYGFPCRNGFY